MPKNDFLREIDGAGMSVTAGGTLVSGGTTANDGFDEVQADAWLLLKTTDDLREGKTNLYDTPVTFSATEPANTKPGLLWIQI